MQDHILGEIATSLAQLQTNVQTICQLRNSLGHLSYGTWNTDSTDNSLPTCYYEYIRTFCQ